MLLQIPLTAINKADTLNYRIHQLQVKVDSLEKVVNKTEIGTGFFSEIISLQLAIFLFILGFSALISWRWFTSKIKSVSIENKRFTLNDTSLLWSHVTKEKIDFDKEYKIVLYNVNRAIYFSVEKDKDPSVTIQWAMASLVSLIETEMKDIHAYEFWSNEIRRNLDKLKPGSLNQAKESKRFLVYIDKLDECNLPEVKDNLGSFKSDILHVVHSKEENADSASETPPII